MDWYSYKNNQEYNDGTRKDYNNLLYSMGLQSLLY